VHSVVTSVGSAADKHVLPDLLHGGEDNVTSWPRMIIELPEKSCRKPGPAIRSREGEVNVMVRRFSPVGSWVIRSVWRRTVMELFYAGHRLGEDDVSSGRDEPTR
jgi:hypothetical protein